MLEASERLLQLVDKPERGLDLAEAALLLAKDAYPDIEVNGYLKRIQHYARAVRERLPRKPSAGDFIFTLNTYLFDDEGFSGNAQDYYNPDNSYLNRVLDNKQGTPIALSIVYISIARCLGFPVYGVSIPGRFLVKYITEQGDVVLDPYAGGVALNPQDMEQLVEDDSAQQQVPSVYSLEAVERRDILLEMLLNLKWIFLQQTDMEKALWVSERILLLAPYVSTEIRDRGLIYEYLDCYRLAIADFQRYLKLEPDAHDATLIAERLRKLQHYPQVFH